MEAEGGTAAAHGGLRRDLGLPEVTALAGSMMLGVGIFFGPSLTAAAFPSWEAVMGLWAVGGLVGLAGAWTFGRLAAMHPHAGGPYVYLREAYGTFPAYLFAWTSLVIIAPTSLAVLASLFAAHVGHAMPLTGTGLALLAVWSLVLFTFVNLLGVKQGGRVQTALTALKLAAVLGMAALLLGAPPAPPPTTGPPGQGTGLLSAAFVGVLFAYGGWEYASMGSGEVRNPARNVPRGMLLGTGLVTVAYLAAVASYLVALGPQGMAQAEALAPEAAARVLAGGAVLVALAVALSAAGSLNAVTLLGPRATYALGADGRAPALLAWVHPRWGTPVAALLLQALLASAFLLTGAFATVAAYTVIGTGLFIIPAALALPRLRARSTGRSGLRKEDAVATALAAVYAWFIGATLFDDPGTALVALGLIGAGVVPYALARPRRAPPAPADAGVS